MPTGRPRRWCPDASAIAYALGVQVQETPVRVVGPLETAIGRAVVQLPELVLGVEGVRVEGLVTAEPGDLLLDPTVVVGATLPRLHVDQPPEPEVHVEPVVLQRVQRPHVLVGG